MVVDSSSLDSFWSSNVIAVGANAIPKNCQGPGAAESNISFVGFFAMRRNACLRGSFPAVASISRVNG